MYFDVGSEEGINRTAVFLEENHWLDFTNKANSEMSTSNSSFAIY